jgi:hypothetical protein
VQEEVNDEGVNVARVRNEVDGTAASGWRGKEKKKCTEITL